VRDDGCNASMKMLVLSERNIVSDEKMGGPPNIGLVSDASKKDSTVARETTLSVNMTGSKF